MNRFVRLHGVCGADEGVDVPLVRRTASGPATGHLVEASPLYEDDATGDFTELVKSVGGATADNKVGPEGWRKHQRCLPSVRRHAGREAS